MQIIWIHLNLTPYHVSVPDIQIVIKLKPIGNFVCLSEYQKLRKGLWMLSTLVLTLYPLCRKLFVFIAKFQISWRFCQLFLNVINVNFKEQKRLIYSWNICDFFEKLNCDQIFLCLSRHVKKLRSKELSSQYFYHWIMNISSY